jgi:peroxiredoxin
MSSRWSTGLLGAGVVAAAILAWLFAGAAPAPIDRGSPAPAFELPRVGGGNPVSLASLRGKVVLLNFWATWCKPCEEEMPGMERLYQKYKDKGLVVLAVSEDADGAGAVAPFVKKHGLTFPIGLDPKMSVAASYGVWALPSTFIIDRNGNRAHFANGPREWDGRAARDLFESMLK